MKLRLSLELLGFVLLAAFVAVLPRLVSFEGVGRRAAP